MGVFVIQVVLLWIEGDSSLDALSVIHIYMPSAIVSFLVLIHYLDERAGKALESMKPLMKVNEDEHARLRYELTTLPPRATFLSSVIMVAIICVLEMIGGQYELEVLATYPISRNVVRVVYYIGFWTIGAFFFHTLHQLKMISRIYTEYTQVNLFKMKPLYAFSNISAITAGALAAITYGWILVNPDQVLTAPAILLNILIFLLALATFIWPQLGIHALQEAEKDRLLEEINLRLEAVMQKVHRDVDVGNLENMTELNMTLTTLELELNAVKRINTWPWQPETVRWLITALVLPLGLWIIQFILQRVMGP
jgi:hypothetical protein